MRCESPLFLRSTENGLLVLLVTWLPVLEQVKRRREHVVCFVVRIQLSGEVGAHVLFRHLVPFLVDRQVFSLEEFEFLVLVVI